MRYNDDMEASMDEVITRYLTSAAQDDTDALVSCFTVNGVVADAGGDHYGRGEIRAWRDELAHRSPHKFEVLGMDEPNKVRTKVAGKKLTYNFTVADGLISRLAIG
jgi:hypothetical protein